MFTNICVALTAFCLLAVQLELLAAMNADSATNIAAAKVSGAYSATAKKMSRMRKAMNDGETVDNNFTVEERKEML